MKITLRIDKEEPLILAAQRCLDRYKKFTFYNAHYKSRHPTAIYKISTQKIFKRTKSLIKWLEVLNDPIKRKQEQEIDHLVKEHTDQYLDAMAEHFDDCLRILKTICDPSDSQKTRAICRKFNNNIGEFRDHIAKQANFLKHEHAGVELVRFHNNIFSLSGYFITGAITSDVICPHPEIHPGSNSAFSYSRELRKNLCGLFFISEVLAKILKENVERVKFNPIVERNEELEEHFENICTLPYVFFPDEYNKIIPEVLIYKEKKIINYPGKNHAPKLLPHNLTITTSMYFDGISNIHKMPYFGKEIGEKSANQAFKTDAVNGAA